MRQKDLIVAFKLGPSFWADCCRALWCLASARRQLGTWSPADVMRAAPDVFRNAPTGTPKGHSLSLVRRVAFAVPRVATHVPWRSDCLVQAVAGQRWLASLGIESTLSIGVRITAEHGFEAHAWLKVGEESVTGGDVSTFSVLSVPPIPSRNGSCG